MDMTPPSAVPVGVLRLIRVASRQHTHTQTYKHTDTHTLATIMSLSYGLRDSMATQKRNRDPVAA